MTSDLDQGTNDQPHHRARQYRDISTPATGGLTRPALDSCPVNIRQFPLSDVSAINSQDHGEPREIQFSFIFAET